MKNPKMRSFNKIFNGLFAFTLIVVLSSFSACEKNDESMLREKPAGWEQALDASITSIAFPAAIKAGESVSVNIQYWAPTPCYTMLGLFVHIEKSEMQLNIYLTTTPDPCIQVIDPREQVIQVVFPAAGMYKVRYNGENGPESMEIVVR